MTKTLIYSIIALIIVIIAGVVTFFLTAPSRSTDQGGNSGGGLFGSLFPFGNGGQNGNTETPLFNGDEPGSGVLSVPKLRQVSVTPVSGAYAYAQGGTPMIRFIDRATGHLYETEAESTTVRRVTNTTVPGIQEVLWANANEFLIRYLDGDSIETFFATLDEKAASEQALNGRFIDSFNRGTLDAAGKNLFSVVENGGGSSLALSDPDGSNAKIVFTSLISSWVPLQSENKLFVYTAPASGVAGFLYQVSGNTLSKVTGDVPGLLAKVSASGRYALISGGGQNSVSAFVFDIQTGETLPLPVDTLADKCAFASETPLELYCGVPQSLPDGAYPNDWLIGSVSLNDSIWSIEPEVGVATFITAGNDVPVSFDVWQPKLSPGGDHFIFINKKDLSLWSLRIKESTSTPENN